MDEQDQGIATTSRCRRGGRNEKIGSRDCGVPTREDAKEYRPKYQHGFMCVILISPVATQITHSLF